ncbi:MAG: hypothetical protein HY766_11670, partial [candidate division NC10 bacterium]|nr:hypothetical protein [candidate division NC10 bacterium]
IQALYNADAGTEEAKMRLSPTNPPTPVCSSTTPTAPKIEVGTSANWRAYVLSGHSQSELPSLDPTYGKAAPNYTTTESTSNYLYCTTVQTGSSQIPWGWARIQHKFNAAGNILYQDAITGNETTSSSQVVGSTTVYNPPLLLVTTEGIQGSVRRMISVEYQPIVSTTTTTTDVITDPFGNAAHGVGPVTLTGNATTDSYDSRLGAYNVNGNLGTNGDISTDSTAGSAVTIEAGSTVNGDVQVGPGGNTSSAIQNNGTITGTTSTEATTWNLPLSSIPTGVVNQGPLSIAGNTVRTLTEGTYWFSSLSISGNGQLQISGAVKIYVTGAISISGNGVATANNAPTNLLIYGTRDPTSTDPACVSSNCATSVAITGNGSFYGAVYAPQAGITVSGNGAVYGALTGASVTVNGNGGLHYDEALQNLGRYVTTTSSTTYTTTGFTRYSWREIAF